jgi:hypothetical protein
VEAFSALAAIWKFVFVRWIHQRPIQVRRYNVDPLELRLGQCPGMCNLELSLTMFSFSLSFFRFLLCRCHLFDRLVTESKI